MSTIYNFRYAIKMSLMQCLYEDQLIYWNRRLTILNHQNLKSYGRKITKREPYAIYFNRRRWLPDFLDWTDKIETAYCLPLHPDFPEMLGEMEIIAEEFDELSKERYEAERFLSSLVLFSAPPHIFKQVLGETLFEVCAADVEYFCRKFPTDQWNCHGEFSMKTFVEENQGILKAMNERILINLVTLDGLQKG